VKLLIIGGNRFLGVELAARRLARGDRVTLLNRGNLGDPFGPLVQRIRVDRGTDTFDSALGETTWDGVVDFALFDGVQAQRLNRVLAGRVGHLIAISTGQVYLVRTPRPVIATEADYAGATLQSAPSAEDEPDWRYGVEKRQVEEVLFRSTLPFTTLRLPMVHGGRDHQRRLDSVLWRLMDGGPIFLTRPQAPIRHVFSGGVVDAIEALLERQAARLAFNLAWSEALSAHDFILRIGESFGVRANIVVAEPSQMIAAGIDPTAASIGNSRWMSALDANQAHRALGWQHPALSVWLPQAVHASVSRWAEPPPSYAQRPLELAFGPKS
jgi:nucleoside-diphosphate-sugar epimerase